MSIVSKKLRDSAGHHNAYCTVQNRQKVLHQVRPETVRAGRAVKQCHCGVWFELPACHAARHSSCTATCAGEKRKRGQESRKQHCATCGTGFIPRPNQLRAGVGRYCSNKCSLDAVRDSEVRLSALRAAAAARRGLPGLIGEANPGWKGGTKATTRRRIESGKANAYTKSYRAKNPDKVREWKQSRRGLGRLPRGTIKKLFALQRGCCALCRTGIADGYHVDHIKPLALGGLHEPGNIQLLCPTCNVRKWCTDPIEYAQRNGRLL